MLAMHMYSLRDLLPFLYLLPGEQREGSRQRPYWRLDDVVVDERGCDAYVSDMHSCGANFERTCE